MKNWLQTFAVVTLLALSTSMAQAGSWELDKAHSNIKFNVKHLMVTNVWGNFDSFDGKISYDQDHPTKGSVEISIDVASIDTDNEKRDGHLRSADFFDVENYPTITFVSKKIQRSGDGLKMTGALTMHGVTKDVTFDITGPSGPVDFMGTEKIAASASTTINRTDFGLNWNKSLETGGVLVGEDVSIVVDIELDKSK